MCVIGFRGWTPLPWTMLRVKSAGYITVLQLLVWPMGVGYIYVSDFVMCAWRADGR